MTLKEYKEDLRDQVSALKSAIYNLRHENDGIDTNGNGMYSRTGKFEMRRDMEIHLEILQHNLKILGKIRKLR